LSVSDSGSINEFAKEFKVAHPLDRFQGMPPGAIGTFHFFEIAKPSCHRLDRPGPGRILVVIAFHNRAAEFITTTIKLKKFRAG